MSVYNGERFLREAIDSILSQTMPDFDFIIINDGSTDGTRDILASYRDRRIVVVHQQNAGLATSLNRGLEMARTELVARMDADDVSLPHRLELQLAEYERLGQPDVLGGHVEFVSENGRSLGSRRHPLNHEDIVRRLENRTGTALVHPTVIYRRDSVLRHGGYDAFFRRRRQDYDLWLRMCLDCRLANTRYIVLRLRLSSAGMEVLSAEEGKASRRSRAWYSSVAMQRYLLQKAGAGNLWHNTETQHRTLDMLWARFEKSRLHEATMARRGLSLVRADLKSPGLRWRGVITGTRLFTRYPTAVFRSLLRRRCPKLEYLSPQEILSGTTAPRQPERAAAELEVTRTGA